MTAEIIPLTPAIMEFWDRQQRPRFKPVPSRDGIAAGLRDALEGRTSDNIRIRSIRPVDYAPEDGPKGAA